MEVTAIQKNSDDMLQPTPQPWGFWPTLGFSAVIAIVYLVATIIVCAGFTIIALAGDSELNVEEFAKALETNGLFLAISFAISAPLVVVLALLFAFIRKNITVGQYLGLRNPGLKEFVKWCVLLGIFVAGSDTLTVFLDQSIVPEFMSKVYTTAYFTPLLWFALVIAAPVSEEIFFRGFLFKGIESSRVGSVGAILLTSALWAILHLQYDAYGIVTIFACGVLLSVARIRTGSVYVTIAMHAMMNLIATCEVAIMLR